MFPWFYNRSRDESALYYSRSRGINKNEAMKMIISSFIEEDLKNLDALC